MSWQLLVEFAVSIAYGVSSALIPIFNSEIYIVASQVGGFAEETTTAIGCAVGLSIGKVGTVLALRRGANFRWVQRIRDHPRKPAGKFRTRLRGWSDRMFGLLGEPRWGAAIVFLSACVYVPPLYPVTLAVSTVVDLADDAFTVCCRCAHSSRPRAEIVEEIRTHDGLSGQQIRRGSGKRVRLRGDRDRRSRTRHRL